MRSTPDRLPAMRVSRATRTTFMVLRTNWALAVMRHHMIRSIQPLIVAGAMVRMSDRLATAVRVVLPIARVTAMHSLIANISRTPLHGAIVLFARSVIHHVGQRRTVHIL